MKIFEDFIDLKIEVEDEWVKWGEFVKLFIAPTTTNSHVESFRSFTATQYFHQVQYSEHKMMWKNFRHPKKKKTLSFHKREEIIESLAGWCNSAAWILLAFFRGWMNTKSNRKFNETKCWDGIAISEPKVQRIFSISFFFFPLYKARSTLIPPQSKTTITISNGSKF